MSMGGALPPVRVVDLRREAGYPLSAPLLAELRAVAESRGKAILLLNRRGLAPALHCRACGSTIRCPDCNEDVQVIEAVEVPEDAFTDDGEDEATLFAAAAMADEDDNGRPFD